MNQRLCNLFIRVVEEYAKTAAPVGSKALTQLRGVDRSSATVRNELAELEELGYLDQPHTSAGRVPTEAGYHYYVEHLLQPAELAKRELDRLRLDHRDRDGLKELARTLAELAHAGVLVAFAPRDIYYTGLSYLFGQPESSDHEFVWGMSAVIDHLDDTLRDVFPTVTPRVSVRVGRDNPFSDRCSVLLLRLGGDAGDDGVVGILGPMRMDYPRNVALLARMHDICTGRLTLRYA